MHAVSCTYVDVSVLADPDLMRRAMAALPWAERSDKAVRYRFAKDRRLSVGAGLLAAHMLRQAGAHDLTLGYGEHGKPFLACDPRIHFNLSHSGHLAVCAVAHVPVGVDVEVVCDHGQDVAERCFQPCELDWMHKEADRAQAFTRLWTRKESLIKLTGSGLSRDPRTLCVLPGRQCEDGVSFEEFTVDDAMLCVGTFGEATVKLAELRLRYDMLHCN